MNRLLLAIVLAAPQSLMAAGRDKPSVTRTARNDGDSSYPFFVTCTESAWSVVGSSITTLSGASGAAHVGIRRRSMTVHLLSSATYAVCLSTTSNSGDSCSDSRPGYELGSAWGSVTIYNEGIWYCRTRAGGSTAIKGVEFFDSRDEVQ